MGNSDAHKRTIAHSLVTCRISRKHGYTIGCSDHLKAVLWHLCVDVQPLGDLQLTICALQMASLSPPAACSASLRC